MKAMVNNWEQTILSVHPFTTLEYNRDYSVSSIILLFFTFSGFGWLWEVLIHIIKDGMIINRGFLTGPWLPIYGTGGILILILLKRWRSRPLYSLALIILLCGVMEYGTSLFLETLFHVKWWDYSDMMFQIHGRICLEGLLIFGIGGLFIIYIVAPLLDNCLRRVSIRLKMSLCMVLIPLFAIDMVHAFLVPNMGFGITF